MIAPGEPTNPFKRDVPFITDNVIPEVQSAVGKENLTVRWLEYTPPTFQKTFLDPSVLKAVGEAAGGTTPKIKASKPMLDALDAAREEGTNTLIRDITNLAACQTRRFIIAGHSLGAAVIGDALKDLANDPNHVLSRVDEVLLWGDPMFDSSQPAAQRPVFAGGSTPADGPPNAVGVLAVLLGPRRPHYLPEELDDRSQSYCWGGPGPIDPVCATFQPGSSGQHVIPEQWAEGMNHCAVPLATATTFVEWGRECGHVKYTGGYAAEYTRAFVPGTGVERLVQPKAATVTVSSTSSWRNTGVPVKKGQKVTITHVSGSWTVDKDNHDLKRVGPAGYPATQVAESPQCKLDEHLPNGQLLAGVEEFRTPVTYTTKDGVVVGTFTAQADGNVELTINDTCPDNNAGLITVRVSTES